jgi:hypothetical protein
LGVKTVSSYIEDPVEPSSLVGEFFIDVQAGDSFTIGLTAAKNVHVWGTLANTYQSPTKVLIRGYKVQKILATSDFNFAMLLSTDGVVYALGTNTRGQLADGTLVDRQAPVTSSLLRDGAIRQAFASYNVEANAMVFVYESKIIVWRDRSASINEWVAMKTSDRIASIQSSGTYTLMITENGTLYATGVNMVGGAVGNGNDGEVYTPTPVNVNGELYKVQVRDLLAAEAYIIGVISNTGEIYAWGSIHDCAGGNTIRSLLPTKLDTNGVKVRSVRMGNMFEKLLVFSEDGNVYQCTSGTYTQLSIPTKLFNATSYRTGVAGVTETGQVALLMVNNIGKQVQGLTADVTTIAPLLSLITLKPIPYGGVEKVIIWEDRDAVISIVVILQDGTSFRGVSEWIPYEKLDPIVSTGTVLVFENNTMLVKLTNSNATPMRPTGTDLKRLISVSTTAAGVVGVFAKCNTGYFGDYCEKPVCNGYTNDDTMVCNSHGQCLSPDMCKCADGYSGANCMTAPLIDDKSGIIIGATAGSVGGVFILLFVVISIGCTIRYRTQVVRQKRVEMEMKTLLHESLIRADQLSEQADMEWVIPFSDLTFLERISEGSFGVVLKGRYKNADV